MVQPESNYDASELLKQYPILSYSNSMTPYVQLIPSEIKAKLHPKEIKRQEAINEFIHTEKTHCKKLVILLKVFYDFLRSDEGLNKKVVSQNEFTEYLPDVENLVSTHNSLRIELESIHPPSESNNFIIHNISDLLNDWIHSPNWNMFKERSLDFCMNQQKASTWVNKFILEDLEFSSKMKDRENSVLCNRLAIDNFLSAQFQRLTKYPLLIDQINKYTKALAKEYKHEKSKLLQKKTIKDHELENLDQQIKNLEKENHQLNIILTEFKDLLFTINNKVKEKQDQMQFNMMEKNIDFKELEIDKEFNEIFSDYKNLINQNKIKHYGQLKYLINPSNKNIHSKFLNEKSRSVHCFLFEECFLITHWSWREI